MILINSSPRDTLKIFQPFLPIYVPIGLGYLMAACQREGIKVRQIDEQIETNIFSLIAQYTQNIDPPYIFGFSVLTASLKQALSVSQQLKTIYPDAVICFGGPHPTAMPAEVLAYEQVDVVVRGEGELILPQLYRCIKSGQDFTHLSNLSYRRNGQIIHNSELVAPEDLDALPQFPYHLFTSSQYELGFVLSSRGCPYHCIFCSNRVTTGKRYRFRSVKAVVEDLKLLYHTYNIRNVHFHDDNLLVNHSHVAHLLKEIRMNDLHRVMTFSFQARGDNVAYPLLQELYTSGFRSVFFGLETASERLMRLIKKGETVAQCVEAVRLAKL